MRIGIVGDYDAGYAPHIATTGAIRHAAAARGVTVEVEWVPTDSIAEAPPSRLSHLGGLIIAPGSPYRDMTGAISAIRFAREHDIPLLGTCGGLQHMIVEFARHVLGIADATHAEYEPDAATRVVTALPCSLAGTEMPLSLVAGSRAAGAYGGTTTVERHICSFGLNPDYGERLHEGGFRIVGTDAAGEARVLEIPRLRFYIGTLYVPQMRSRPDEPHPLVASLLAAA